MSVRIMNWAWHDPATQHLRGNAAMALLALADIADDDGNVVYAKGAKRSQESLAKKARMSVATFRRVTSDLVEQGFLEVTRESPRSENEYRVVVTAQSERSQVSGQTVDFERSHRSPVSGHPSYRRIDVRDVSLSPDESVDAVLIPEQWRPNQSHIDKAASLHLDVRAEYQRFRAHAEREHRRLKNWNTGFTNWLRKSAEFAQKQSGGLTPNRTFAQQKQSNTLALVEQLRKEEAREEVGSGNAAGLQALA